MPANDAFSIAISENAATETTNKYSPRVQNITIIIIHSSLYNIIILLISSFVVVIDSK